MAFIILMLIVLRNRIRMAIALINHASKYDSIDTKLYFRIEFSVLNFVVVVLLLLLLFCYLYSFLCVKALLEIS